jgi:hypothetical protein
MRVWLPYARSLKERRSVGSLPPIAPEIARPFLFTPKERRNRKEYGMRPVLPSIGQNGQG